MREATAWRDKLAIEEVEGDPITLLMEEYYAFHHIWEHPTMMIPLTLTCHSTSPLSCRLFLGLVSTLDPCWGIMRRIGLSPHPCLLTVS
jgi:hypothetical protein